MKEVNWLSLKYPIALRILVQLASSAMMQATPLAVGLQFPIGRIEFGPDYPRLVSSSVVDLRHVRNVLKL